MRDDVIERVFALFTSNDRAEAIAGDLREERDHYGWAWCWMQVVRITLALWRNAVADAPLGVMALTMVGCVLFAVPAFGGVAAMRLFPDWVTSPVSWLALTSCWWGGAMVTGASLVAIAPRHGMAACAMLAIAAEVLLIVFGVTALSGDAWRADEVLVFAIGLVVAAALLTGGSIARQLTGAVSARA